MKKISIAGIDRVQDRKPAYALVANVDLVIVRYDDQVSVLYGRCAHRGALLADGIVAGDNLICGVHGWDYQFATGVSEHNNNRKLHMFSSWLEQGEVWVDEDEIAAWEKQNPQPYKRDAYQGLYQDFTGTSDEPHVKLIQKLARLYRTDKRYLLSEMLSRSPGCVPQSAGSQPKSPADRPFQ